ncbi:hypothetical protein H6F89_27110 [Cyanobacteria bacterium FACHB-63]|nr:hypothetical protein [Cyanobacteria bacterium FACHB-63]
MSEDILFDSMPKERLSIEIGDLKDRVESCRNTPAWRELSMSGKLRSLILERLEEIESEERQEENAKK